MFDNHFYWQTIRNVVSVFGTLFNDIHVVRRDSAGNMLSTFKCPLAYGPKQKFLARIDQQNSLNDPKIAIKLPRLSFELTSMTYDGTMKLSKNNRHQIQATNTPSQTTLLSPVNYRVGLQLNIIAKNQDDALQILEQILPYFQPDYTVTVKQVNGEFSNDMPFVLQGVSMADEYEGDYLTKRAIVYTLEFETRVKFYSGSTNQSLITRVTTDFRDTDDQSLTQRQTVITNPINANPDDNYTVDVINTLGNVPDELILTVADSTGFKQGDVIVGTTSLSSGLIVGITGNDLRVLRPEAIFTVGELITVVGEAVSSTITAQSEVYNV